MNLAEAIETAMAYEGKIRDVYAQALTAITDPVGRRIIETLRDDEQYHLDYLDQQLRQWRTTGRLKAESLGRRLPSREELTRSSERFEKEMSTEARGDSQQALVRSSMGV
jgi:rubrerythrin